MNSRRKIPKLPGAFVIVMFLALSLHANAQTSELASWSDGPAKQAIVSFVKEVTDKSGTKYVEPQDRIAGGKTPTAHLLLKAQHQSGQVVIEISDDGRGLDAAKIRNKGVQKGLISPEKELTESEIFNLIFEPGFTTRSTAPSGAAWASGDRRGLGLEHLAGGSHGGADGPAHRRPARARPRARPA